MKDPKSKKSNDPISKRENFKSNKYMHKSLKQLIFGRMQINIVTKYIFSLIILGKSKRLK
jgi:hypothetical protein